MSEQIDWSKAPEGATHYVPAPNDLHHPIWLKMDGQTVLNAGYIGHDHWAHTYTRGSQPCTDLSNAIARPTTPSWSGEGMASVGADIEVKHELYGWIGARVVGQDGEASIVRTNDGYAGVFPHQMRPIRTSEQIAADEREAAVDEMHKLYMEGAKHSGGLYALYDAGYRKP